MAELDKLLVGFLVDEVVGGFFISVPPGHIACVYDRGRGVLKKVWGPGLHLKIPFWQVAKLFNAQVLEYTIRHDFDLTLKEALGDEAINAATSDNKLISVEGSILFHIAKDNAPSLWENVGDNFVSKVVRPVSRSRIRIVLAENTSTELANHRTVIENKIKEELNKMFTEKGLVCDGVLLSDVKFLAEHSSRQLENIVTQEESVVFKEDKKESS
ncbi:prohibitin family protein [Candidatus Microgenomates bacterium]|nr:prohibitin family protein [Candidatus Microgenomates bacterium]